MKKQFILLVTAIVLLCSFVTSETEPKYYEVCRKAESLSEKLLKEGGIIKAMPQKYMSRCPTGLRAHYNAKTATAPVYEGVLNYNHGCKPQKICLFQLNYETDKLLVKSTKEGKYISLQKWIKNQQTKKTNKSTSL